MISPTNTKTESKTYQKAAGIVIVLSLIFLFARLIPHLSIYTKHFNAEKSAQKYNASQWTKSTNNAEAKVLDTWAVSKKYTGWSNYIDENKNKVNIQKVQRDILDQQGKNSISDNELYSYAGYRYIQGENPILINPEVPPLGKYIIGASIVIFKNEYIASTIFALVSIALAAYLTFVLTKHSLKAVALTVLFMCTSSFILDQMLHAPQLEIFQLVFLLLNIIFLSRYYEKRHFADLVIASLLAGAFSATKIFLFSSALMYGMVFSIVFFNKTKLRETVKILLVFSAGIFAVLLTSYLSYFLHGGTLKSFLGVQKWIYVFYQDSTIVTSKIFGSYIPLILINKWKVWSTGYPYVRYDQWSLLWPVFFVSGLLSAIKLLFVKFEKKEKSFFIPLVSFAGVYMIALLIIPVFPRYLTLLYPFLYIFTAVGFDTLIKSKN